MTKKIADALNMADAYAHTGEHDEQRLVARANAGWDELREVDVRLAEGDRAREEARHLGNICKRVEEALGPGAGPAWERIAQLKVDLERARAEAWNEAIEAAAERADGGPLYVRGVLMTPSERIRALKRTT